MRKRKAKRTRVAKTKSDNPFLQSSYDYTLPSELIATAPVFPRDHARLLVYERATQTLTHARFDALFDFIPPQCAILLNDTKVIKARLFGTKQSGGKVELLLNSPLPDEAYKVYIRGKVVQGTVLLFQEELNAHVEALHEDGMRIVRFTCKDIPVSLPTLYDILERIGHIPLPPYIKREDNQDDAHDYQSVFAAVQGAVAAPTASLHFTQEMLETLQKRHKNATLTLHVGAGTFKPVEALDIRDHVMHEEQFYIPTRAQTLIDSPTPLLAVGTTVTRTVEYYARTKKLQGACDLFLHPHNPPQRITHLLTNFHLPKSTLLMLVAGFVGVEKTLELYEEAVKERYRFFSYGDAMLVL
ncbi:MAG: tRNA preQ1(34) S-adenosylmethionine ribosyltransferase-isomerase QueA [Campylobacterales bacterium]|nr:tRNA preQ1(34) S-adenosylmethionine ribosyltransferase-isomerase QueA [Campylobacterales bacterium]